MRGRTLCALMMAPALLLCGCAGGRADLDRVQALREEYAALTACSGTAELTADYGRRVYEYTVEFSLEDGALILTVTAPEEVAGVTARAAEGETTLAYDGAELETGALSPDGLSPLSALPALLDRAARGFSDSCGKEEDGAVFRVDYRDPEASPGVGAEASLWFGPEGDLLRGELYQDGRMVIRCELTDFERETETG